MTDGSERPVLTERDNRLYASILLDVWSDPNPRAIHAALDDRSKPVYDAIYERLPRLVQSEGWAAWSPDEVDWAAIRAVVPVESELADPAEFQTVTGSTLADARDLEEKASRAMQERPG